MLCLAYGFVLTVALGGRDALVEPGSLSELFSGYFVLPIAVVLVAAHSVSPAPARGEVPLR